MAKLPDAQPMPNSCCNFAPASSAITIFARRCLQASSTALQALWASCLACTHTIQLNKLPTMHMATFTASLRVPIGEDQSEVSLEKYSSGALKPGLEVHESPEVKLVA